MHHVTVLRLELVKMLNLKPTSWSIDCTAGYGGHLSEIINSTQAAVGRVFAIDRDENAINFLKNKFTAEINNEKLCLIHRPFSELFQIAQEYDLLGKIDAICADIGVSSPQLDIAERGFSLSKNGPLDMRMDPRQDLTAKEIVNHYDKSEIIHILRIYGEEPKAKFIANAIVDYRKNKTIETTDELSEIVSKNVFYKKASRKHPATKTFQALRIAVNDELGELETLCHEAFEILKPGGRLGIISFHSLEDRIIKNKFKKLAQGDRNSSELRNLPITNEKFNDLLNIKASIVKPFPLKPTEEEIENNPRSRSAKLRVLEKI